MKDNELKSDVRDIAIETGENLLDSLMDDPILGAIPIMRTALCMIKGGLSIQNHLYLKKLSAFLEETKKGNVTNKSIEDCLRKCNKNAEQFRENLLFLIDKSDNEEKAKLLGFFVSEFLNRKISYEDFTSFIHSVNGIPIHILKQFSKKHDKGDAYIQDQLLFGYLNAHGCITQLDEFGNIHIDPVASLDSHYKLTKSAKQFGKLLRTYFCNYVEDENT